MKAISKMLRVVAVIVLILLGLGVLLMCLNVAAPFGGYDLLLAEFVAGFVFFLRENLPAISTDAGTWGPGLGAFLVSWAMAHRFLSRWAAGTTRHWSAGTSFCVVLMIPVLFVISFIVPGVLLQWELLREIPWLEIS